MARFLAALLVGLMLSMSVAHAQEHESANMTITPDQIAAFGILEGSRRWNPMWLDCPYTLFVGSPKGVLSPRALWGAESWRTVNGELRVVRSKAVEMPEVGENGWTEASWKFGFIQACTTLKLREKSLDERWSGKELILKAARIACLYWIGEGRRDAVEAYRDWEMEKKYGPTPLYPVDYTETLSTLQTCLDENPVTE